MAMALKHKPLELSDIPAGAREAVTSMAKMSEDSLKDYMHVQAKKPQKKSLLGGSH